MNPEKNETVENYEEYFQTEPKKGQPKWMRQLPDESWLVKTKKGIFKLIELEWGKIEKARKRTEKGDPNEAILSDSIIGLDGKPVSFGELEIRTWKGGVVLRLLGALNLIYEVDDFLSGFGKEE